MDESLRGTREGSSDCAFCNRIALGDILIGDQLAVALCDAFPVSPGHVLVAPRRHEADFFSLADEERAAMFDILLQMQRRLASERQPDGYNVGLNIGQAAGQTVPHAHIHLIPRYVGDHPDPRGGVRWVIPEKAAYWRRDG